MKCLTLPLVLALVPISSPAFAEVVELNCAWFATATWDPRSVTDPPSLSPAVGYGSVFHFSELGKPPPVIFKVDTSARKVEVRGPYNPLAGIGLQNVQPNFEEERVSWSGQGANESARLDIDRVTGFYSTEEIVWMDAVPFKVAIKKTIKIGTCHRNRPLF